MVMPTEPTAQFIVVETDFHLARPDDGLYGPTHATDAHQFSRVNVGRGIAEVVFDFAGVIQVAAHDQPEFLARQALPHFDDAQTGKITDQGPFGAFFDLGADPGFCRQLLGQFINLDCLRFSLTQAEAGWTTTFALPRRHPHGRSFQPNAGRAAHFNEVPLVQSRNPIPKSDRIAVQFVRRHPSKGQFTSFKRLFQQGQGNFGFGLIAQFLRDATSLMQRVVCFCEPRFWQVQAGIQKTVAFAAGIAQVNAHLRVGYLPHRATPLPGHAHRMLTLFDDPGFIHQHHAVLFTQGSDHLRLMSFQQSFTRPRALTNEVLQTAHIHPKPQSDPLRHLARQIAQQAFQVSPALGSLIAALKGGRKVLIVAFQLSNHLVNIFFSQIPFRRRTNIRYNFCGHGSPFSFHLVVFGRRLPCPFLFVVC